MLRCLKVWYELPNDVLFAAINLVDRFLTKMKVRPKHMACISVSSFRLAVQQLNLPLIDTEDLVAISQVSEPMRVVYQKPKSKYRTYMTTEIADLTLTLP